MVTPSASGPDVSIGLRAAALPLELTTFIGRASELEEIQRLIGVGRLLTLTGAGGSGKTRLAVEAAARLAEEFPAGIAWVEFAGVSDPDLVPRQVGASLGIREEGGVSATQALIEAVRDRSLLLVLDNCEHLADACAVLADALLRSCPGLKLLATSREALGVASERAWLVSSLSFPDPDDESGLEQLVGFEAVQLFIARAQDVLPSFRLTRANGECVARICHRLDGIPLAIELAAARVKVLTPEQIIERLDDAFALLTSSRRTALPRHRTLRATIDWSYDLLSPPERLLLGRLSVFTGGFTLEAAENVCSHDGLQSCEVLDLLARLVDRSLVMMRERDGAARYHLLETVRQYALVQLDAAGEAEAMQHRHAHCFLAFAEIAEPHLFAGAGNPRWVVLVDDELGNLRAASEWFLSEGRDVEAALRLLTAIHWYWFARGRFTEGRTRLEAAISTSSDAAPVVRAKARSALAMNAIWQGDHTSVPALLADAIAWLRELNEDHVLAYALTSLGWSRIGEDPSEANAILREAVRLSRTGEPSVMTAVALYWAGFAAQAAGDGEAARDALDEAIAIGRQLEHKPGIAHPLTGRGRVAILQGDHAMASSCLAEALRLHRQTEDRWGAIQALDGLARVAHAAGAHDRAALLVGAATAIRRAIGVSPPVSERPEHDRLLRELQDSLGAAPFASCFAEGQARSFDQIVEYALERSGTGTGAEGIPERGGSPVSPAMVGEPGESTDGNGRRGAPLEVLALGPLKIYREGQLLSDDVWPYAKPKELLVFLMLHQTGRTREQIGEALWPAASRAQVKNSFHVTLHHLRKALGGAEWIVIEGNHYRLSPAARGELDAEQFERAAREALKDPAAGAGRLRSILALYRGDLLDGEVVGPWVEEHRDRFRRCMVALGLALGAALEAEDDPAAAADAYYAIAAREDLNEEAQRRLMLAWARAGDRVRALRHYERLVALLRDELDADPEPETVRVYETLRLTASS
jgi:predicted ATPase/DNA-binding SARP family transcriptional activator